MCAGLAREVERWDKYRHNRSSITRQRRWESAPRTSVTGVRAEALRPGSSGKCLGTEGRSPAQEKTVTGAPDAVKRSRWPRLCRIPRPRRSARCLRTTLTGVLTRKGPLATYCRPSTTPGPLGKGSITGDGPTRYKIGQGLGPYVCHSRSCGLLLGPIGPVGMRSDGQPERRHPGPAGQSGHMLG